MPMNRVAASDLVLYFRPTVRAWLFGRDAYEVPGYVNPPWTLPLMVPFSLGTPRVSYVLFFLFSFAVLAGAVRFFGGSLWMLLGVLVAPPTVALLSLGQVDIWVLLGVIVGCWAADRGHWAALGLALPLLLIKPQVGGLAVLLWVLTLPRWLAVRALVLLGVVWIVTCLAVGMWWPFQVDFAQELGDPLRRYTVSTLSLTRGLGLSPVLYLAAVAGLLALWVREVRRHRSTEYVVSLSLLVGMLCAPYIHRHSLSIALVTALVLVQRRSRLWGLVCYALTWVPFLSLLLDRWQRWWEIGAWWLLLVGLVFVGRQTGEG
jgi:hypothetical protein